MPNIVHHYDTVTKVLAILLIIMVVVCITLYKAAYEAKNVNDI